ncbi:alpha/beta hydrolase, partial [Streptomyces sp. SID625]|nr:alpha/beta hydrolase [Streptomyces sp. SID625]
MPVKPSTRSLARRCACAGAVTLGLLGACLPAAAADGGQPGLGRFYRQKVTWSACEAGAPKDL